MNFDLKTIEEFINNNDIFNNDFLKYLNEEYSNFYVLFSNDFVNIIDYNNLDELNFNSILLLKENHIKTLKQIISFNEDFGPIILKDDIFMISNENNYDLKTNFFEIKELKITYSLHKNLTIEISNKNEIKKINDVRINNVFNTTGKFFLDKNNIEVLFSDFCLKNILKEIDFNIYDLKINNENDIDYFGNLILDIFILERLFKYFSDEIFNKISLELPFNYLKENKFEYSDGNLKYIFKINFNIEQQKMFVYDIKVGDNFLKDIDKEMALFNFCENFEFKKDETKVFLSFGYLILNKIIELKNILQKALTKNDEIVDSNKEFFDSMIVQLHDLTKKVFKEKTSDEIINKIFFEENIFNKEEFAKGICENE